MVGPLCLKARMQSIIFQRREQDEWCYMHLIRWLIWGRQFKFVHNMCIYYDII